MEDSLGTILGAAALQQPYIGNPNLQRQGALARVGSREDRFSGPATAFLGGLLGVAPEDQGGSVLDPNSAISSSVAANLGHVAGLVGMAAPLGNALFSLGKSAKMGSSMASKSAGILDPKPLPPRPFHDDYPQATAGDVGSRIATDIEGRPLTARYVAGRRMVGEADTAINTSGIDDIGSLLGAAALRGNAAGELKGAAGRYIRDASPDLSLIHI